MQITLEHALDLAERQRQAGNLAEAEKTCRWILGQDSRAADAIHLLGIIAFTAGRHESALQLIQQAIALQPKAEFFGNLGIVVCALGRLQEGIAAYRQALAIRPNYPEALSNLGNALCLAGQWAEAADLCGKAITLRPDFAEGYNNLADALNHLGRAADALGAAERAIHLRPEFPEAHNNAGNAMLDLGNIDRAIEHYQKSVALWPQYVHGQINLAGALMEVGRFSEAADACRAALAVQGDNPLARHTLADALLAAGNFADGWDAFAWHADDRAQRPPGILFLGSKLWTGQPLAGKRLLVYTPKNFGDSIQFVRFIPQLKSQGATIILACPGAMTRLFSTMNGIDQFIRFDDRDVDRFDYFLPMTAAPKMLGTNKDSILNRDPYLRADEKLAGKFKSRLSEGKLKVGLAWSGSNDNPKNRRRSTNLAALAPLAKIPGAQFYSLQKDKSREASPFEIADWTQELADFADTAALIDSLDVVITVDTAVAHLAGALGKRVFLMLGKNPSWRWLGDAQFSTWYPTIKLIRREDFSAAAIEVARDLSGEI